MAYWSGLFSNIHRVHLTRRPWSLFATTIAACCHVAALLLATQASAALLTVDGVAILDGPILLTEVKDFLAEAKTKAQSVSLLRVRSRGGDVLGGLLLARWMTDQAVDIEVQEVCASSCANYLFPAARHKRILADALLIWHGGAHQRSFQEFAHAHEEALVRAALGQPLPGDALALAKGSTRYEQLRLQQSMERALFDELGVDRRLPTLGQEGGAAPFLWTLTPAAMRAMGLQHIDAPGDYASPEQVQTWTQRRASESGRSPLHIKLLGESDLAQPGQCP